MVNKKKLCFVTIRYGLDIIGGAEQCCRQFAENLSKNFDVTVLTTTAFSYTRWEPYYDEGEEIINNVKVIRFNSKTKYNDEKFTKLHKMILDNKESTKSKSFFNKFIKTRGPVCKGLLKYIKKYKKDYDYFLFIPYNYWTSAYCLKFIKENTVLMSCCHDEPTIYIHYDELFNSAKIMWYNTKEEEEFVNKRFPKTNGKKSIIPGIGYEEPTINPEMFSRDEIKQLAKENYILYVGRIDSAKGCITLIEYFNKYKNNRQNNLKLVLAGAVFDQQIYQQHKCDEIMFAGTVSKDEKDLLMRNAVALINPSEFESFSMVIIEAFANKTPVIVNGKSEVLKGHCIRSNGGFYYTCYNQFEKEIELLFNDKTLRDNMGLNGEKYAITNYSWDNIVKKVTDFLYKQ